MHIGFNDGIDSDSDRILASGDEDENTPCSNFRINEDRLLNKFCCSRFFRIILFIIALMIIYFIYTFLFSHSHAASQSENQPSFNHSKANQIIHSLCDSYKHGAVSGDICSKLCNSPNWTLSDLYEGGSKHVLKLKENDKNIILKMHLPYITNYDHVDPKVSEEEFTDKVTDIINEQTNLNWPKRYKNHLIKTLWPSYKKNPNGNSLSEADRRSLWALLQQDEFINFKILQLSRVVPKVLGTCGHVYQAEYLIPFRMKGYYMNLKAKILVHLMGTLKLFYEFLNDPLQWCDVKFENLGLSADYPKRFVVMDSDMLYTETKLRALLTSQKCVTDDQCMHFDCESRCDNTTGHCTDRLNDNVDVFCKKLINRLFGNYWSKSNRYLAACHEAQNATKRLADLRLVWSWSLSDV
uniref:FAM69 protein-kinase domain-containing protein n=1 Tax=Acrobeloides nanus TaxID=290746 RepID=A0A914BYI1_9BILA